MENEFNTKEFRLGNIYESLGRPVVVAMITKEMVCFEDDGKGIGEIKPIPLTEEFLLKFGATKLAGNYEFKKLGFNLNNREAYLINKYGIYTLSQSIKYVHQLQNLYFALTGEELTLKE